MKSILSVLMAIFMLLFLSACQDKDIERADTILKGVNAENITGQLIGDDYVWTWPALPSGQQMQVRILENGTVAGTELLTTNTYTHATVNTNIEYAYIFKVTDGTNFSPGVVKIYTREGATQIAGVKMSQVDKLNGYDAKVEWEASTDAETIKFVATNGTRTITENLAGSIAQYVIADVKDGEVWTVTLTAINAKGSSLPTNATLKVGKTTIGFLSIYQTAEELIANGDDDEVSAWLWLKSQYETAIFVPFSTISQVSDIEAFRVLFWIRDLENVSENDVWTMPAAVQAATPVVTAWYKAGGNLLLWGHATPYIGDLGRMDKAMMKSNDHVFGMSEGGINNDTWAMAVQLNVGGATIDMSTHPIYSGLTTRTINGLKAIDFKGPGWTEDHNCLYFNIPAQLTGLANNSTSIYSVLTETYGIYPLGVWDSQTAFVSQLNVWEIRQGNTDYQGTVICVGNGGCEFSMKNADGTPDKSASPSNNKYQANILNFAKNSLEYLKVR